MNWQPCIYYDGMKHNTNIARPIPPLNQSTIDRFWSRVQLDKKTGCYLWTGTLNRQGYGMISIGQHAYIAHRISYYLHHGSIDPHLQINHKCNTKNCINPEHLCQSTAKQNNIDMRDSGIRYSLTWAEVRKLRKEFLAGKSIRQLATKYKISASHCCDVTNNRVWNDPEYSPPRRTLTCRYRGVYRAGNKKYRSCVEVNGKKISLGYFTDPVIAALRYDGYILRNNLNRPTNFIHTI